MGIRRHWYEYAGAIGCVFGDFQYVVDIRDAIHANLGHLSQSPLTLTIHCPISGDELREDLALEDAVGREVGRGRGTGKRVWVVHTRAVSPDRGSSPMEDGRSLEGSRSRGSSRSGTTHSKRGHEPQEPGGEFRSDVGEETDDLYVREAHKLMRMSRQMAHQAQELMDASPTRSSALPELPLDVGAHSTAASQQLAKKASPPRERGVASDAIWRVRVENDGGKVLADSTVTAPAWASEDGLHARSGPLVDEVEKILLHHACLTTDEVVSVSVYDPDFDEYVLLDTAETFIAALIGQAATGRNDDRHVITFKLCVAQNQATSVFNSKSAKPLTPVAPSRGGQSKPQKSAAPCRVPSVPASGKSDSHREALCELEKQYLDDTAIVADNEAKGRRFIASECRGADIMFSDHSKSTTTPDQEEQDIRMSDSEVEERLRRQRERLARIKLSLNDDGPFADFPQTSRDSRAADKSCPATARQAPTPTEQGEGSKLLKSVAPKIEEEEVDTGQETETGSEASSTIFSKPLLDDGGSLPSFSDLSKLRDSSIVPPKDREMLDAALEQRYRLVTQAVYLLRQELDQRHNVVHDEQTNRNRVGMIALDFRDMVKKEVEHARQALRELEDLDDETINETHRNIKSAAPPRSVQGDSFHVVANDEDAAMRSNKAVKSVPSPTRETAWEEMPQLETFVHDLTTLQHQKRTVVEAEEASERDAVLRSRQASLRRVKLVAEAIAERTDIAEEEAAHRGQISFVRSARRSSLVGFSTLRCTLEEREASARTTIREAEDAKWAKQKDFEIFEASVVGTGLKEATRRAAIEDDENSMRSQLRYAKKLRRSSIASFAMARGNVEHEEDAGRHSEIEVRESAERDAIASEFRVGSTIARLTATEADVRVDICESEGATRSQMKYAASVKRSSFVALAIARNIVEGTEEQDRRVAEEVEVADWKSIERRRNIDVAMCNVVADEQSLRSGILGSEDAARSQLKYVKEVAFAELMSHRLAREECESHEAESRDKLRATEAFGRQDAASLLLLLRKLDRLEGEEQRARSDVVGTEMESRVHLSSVHRSQRSSLSACAVVRKTVETAEVSERGDVAGEEKRERSRVLHALRHGSCVIVLTSDEVVSRSTIDDDEDALRMQLLYAKKVRRSSIAAFAMARGSAEHDEELHGRDVANEESVARQGINRLLADAVARANILRYEAAARVETEEAAVTTLFQVADAAAAGRSAIVADVTARGTTEAAEDRERAFVMEEECEGRASLSLALGTGIAALRLCDDETSHRAEVEEDEHSMRAQFSFAHSARRSSFAAFALSLRGLTDAESRARQTLEARLATKMTEAVMPDYILLQRMVLTTSLLRERQIKVTPALYAERTDALGRRVDELESEVRGHMVGDYVEASKALADKHLAFVSVDDAYVRSLQLATVQAREESERHDVCSKAVVAGALLLTEEVVVQESTAREAVLEPAAPQHSTAEQDVMDGSDEEVDISTSTTEDGEEDVQPREDGVPPMPPVAVLSEGSGSEFTVDDDDSTTDSNLGAGPTKEAPAVSASVAAALRSSDPAAAIVNNFVLGPLLEQRAAVERRLRSFRPGMSV